MVTARPEMTRLMKCGRSSRARPVSASLIALQDGQPLASYVYTGAAWKNRGLAHALLECSMDALAGAGYTTLALWVTAGNVPAERVYRALGFQ